MAEPDKRQIGDGSDNYGEAAKQMAKAAKEAGIETAKQAAVKGAEAGANAAAATVQAGVEGGKAVAEIAAGTAAGGPWGAILSAAWAMRHTLFKILVCICLFFLVIIVLIVSLPSVVTNSVFGLDGSMVDMENPTTLLESYNHLAADISAVVEEGYANLNLLGTSGAGKTFTMQLLALRMRMRGIQCYILAPIKGHEFRRACNKIGGEFIKIAPGSPHCINVMEIRHTMSPEMELIDEIDYVEMGSMLARKIQQLMTFFGLLIPDMSNEEEQMLDEALIRTYADFGITHDNDSIYTDMSSVPPKMKQMPILGDLHKHLQENPMTQRLAAIISRFVTGSAQSFNRQTNVDLSNKYIVLDLSELKGKLLPVGMFIALDYVWDQIKSALQSPGQPHLR